MINNYMDCRIAILKRCNGYFILYEFTIWVEKLLLLSTSFFFIKKVSLLLSFQEIHEQNVRINFKSQRMEDCFKTAFIRGECTL